MMRDFRSLYKKLEDEKRILHIKKPVRWKHEAPALLKKTRGEMPVCFDAVEGYTVPLAAGFGGTRQLLAESMSIRPEELAAHLAGAIVSPIPVHTVTRPPVQENVVTAPFDLSQYFPILQYNEQDSGQYLVSGVMTARDVSGQKLYTSIRRMQYLGGNRFTILITSHEMKRQFEYYERNRQPMDIAVMFGVVPAVILASQISTHLYDINKLDVTGALLGESLPVTRCKTVDVDVLAEAEVVLEGRVKPWMKHTEGPFGEMAGYYGQVADLPVVELTAVTFRNNPIFQTVHPSGSEEKLPMALNREVVLLNTIRQTVPNVKQVHITPGGAGRYHAVVQIRKTLSSDGRQTALAAFAADKDLKHVVVVDEDVDIFNPEEVEWAVATRMQADRDIFIVGGAGGSPLEPSHNLTGTSAKMGLDATAPVGDPHFERTRIPGEENVRLEDYME